MFSRAFVLDRRFAGAQPLLRLRHRVRDLGAIVDLLSWATLSGTERSFHVVLILMFGAVVFAVIGQSAGADGDGSATTIGTEQEHERP